MFHKGSFVQIRQGHYGNDFEEELTSLYNKKFNFVASADWNLPEAESLLTSPPWKVKELECLKSKLNFHKSQLNDFDIEEWSNHTRRRNPAGEVCWKVKTTIDPEFLTQAWTKFYECAYSFDIIPQEVITDKKIVSLHLCEAPGAFITSLNHYLKSHYDSIEWKWLANTLNPYYEGNSLSNMINDDRFMFYTLDNWHFGEDSTGNLMNWENSQAIVKKVTSLGKVQLVTADGSIDCMQRPDAQEEVTSPLHYCEIVTALQALTKGGTLLYKLFTMYEHTTVNILYLLCNMFEDVNIYKPATSRQGNSEVYAICLRYKGTEVLEKSIPKLKSVYGTEEYASKALFSLEQIPKSFLQQVIDCARYFCDMQCQVINNNLQAYLMPKAASQHKDMKRIRAIVANQFIYYYELSPLNHEHEILKGELHKKHSVNVNPRFHKGSHTERQKYSDMTLKEKCIHLKSNLLCGNLSNSLYIQNGVTWLNNFKRSDVNIVFTFGLPLKEINSSSFIYVPVMRFYKQIMNEDDFKNIVISKQLCHSMPDTSLEDDVESKFLHLPEYNHSQDYNIYEKNCFEILLDTLKDMSLNETLIVKNFSALTNFNVSVLYVLSTNCFENTGLTSDCNIILKKMIDSNTLELLNLIKNEYKQKDENVDVLNFLSVRLTKDGDFYYNVISYNNTFYTNKCKDYILRLEQTFCNK